MMMPFSDYVYVCSFFLHCYYGIDHLHLHNHIVDASPYMIFFLLLQGPNQSDHLRKQKIPRIHEHTYIYIYIQNMMAQGLENEKKMS